MIFFGWESRDSRPAWRKLEEIRPILIDKYGEPNIEVLTWERSTSKLAKDIYKDDPMGAIDQQHGQWNEWWVLDDLLLEVVLAYQDEGIFGLMLTYTNPEKDDQIIEEARARERIQF